MSYHECQNSPKWARTRPIWPHCRKILSANMMRLRESLSKIPFVWGPYIVSQDEKQVESLDVMQQLVPKVPLNRKHWGGKIESRNLIKYTGLSILRPQCFRCSGTQALVWLLQNPLCGKAVSWVQDARLFLTIVSSMSRQKSLHKYFSLPNVDFFWYWIYFYCLT